MSLLDCLRIDRRADRPGDRQRRAAEHEFVDLVARAVVREVLQVEDFAHRNADHGYYDPVPRLERFGAFIRPHFAAPGIEADSGDLLLVDPLAGLEAQPGSVAGGIGAPVVLRETMLHLPGAHDHEVAAPDLDALRLGARVE